MINQQFQHNQQTLVGRTTCRMWTEPPVEFGREGIPCMMQFFNPVGIENTGNRVGQCAMVHL